MKIISIILIISGLIFIPALKNIQPGQAEETTVHKLAVREMMSEIYADSVMKTLTLDEKIAQLIMMDVYPNKNESYYKTIDKWVKDKKVGGIIIFRGEPGEINRLTHRYSSQATIPLWVALDAEWGVSMRVDSIRRLPYAMTLGAITDNYIVREYGQWVASQCIRLGVNMNMAPVADVNNNPRNPVINYRSFGEDPENVAIKAIAYYMGMNDEGVVAVGKHFPGHGNTDADSHYELPLVNDSRQVIDSVHLFPFKELIKYGLPGIMSAHLYIPAIDPSNNLASSLSPKVLNDLLLQEMNYHGIVITDALGMQGVSDHFKPGEMEVLALLAGNDILLMPQKPQVAIDSIKAAVYSGRIPLSLIDEKCKKILKFKYVYLSDYQLIDNAKGIPADLNNQDLNDFIYRVHNHAMTLVVNNDSLIPVKDVQGKKNVVVSVGRQTETEFVRTMKQYAAFDHVMVSQSPVEMEINRTLSAIGDADKVIICVYGMNNSARKRYGINESVARFIYRVSSRHKVGLVLFGNPYGLNYLSEISWLKSVIVAYEECEESERSAAMGVCGLLPFRGKLPVSAGGFSAGTGHIDSFKKGLEIVDPLDLKVNLKALESIDSCVFDAIDKGAMPGCQIVIAWHGKVFFHKSFGYHTYENEIPVRNSDLYDLASLTKILATTAAVMKLFSEEKIALNDQLKKHLLWTRDSPIGNLTISEIMCHQSGLVGWIPFYKNIVTSDSVRNIYLADKYSPEFALPVADDLWLMTSYKDTLYQKILDTKIQRKRYKYSDLGFILLRELIENVTGVGFDEYLHTTFYKPMQLNTMTFNPLDKFNKSRIVPTELDTVFRNQLVHGYVHDPAAAMLGGFSGHAGLFGNALDVAAMMQMFLDYGKYGGHRYLDSTTVSKFTSKQFPANRRALGFDRPDNMRDKGNSCEQASNLSFGHTGFTGTFAWADPKHGLVVVFLSNRVYPDAENRKLGSLKVRKKVQKYAYKAIHVQ